MLSSCLLCTYTLHIYTRLVTVGNVLVVVIFMSRNPLPQTLLCLTVYGYMHACVVWECVVLCCDIYILLLRPQRNQFKHYKVKDYICK